MVEPCVNRSIDLDRARILQSAGRPRGLGITPKPPTPEPPVIVHDDSVVVVSVSRRQAFVLEVTGRNAENYPADLDTIGGLLPRPGKRGT